MSHILVTQIKDNKEYKMVVKIADISYSNKASEGVRGTFLNLNTFKEATSVRIKETAEKVYQLIEEKNYLAVSIDELNIIAKTVG